MTDTAAGGRLHVGTTDLLDAARQFEALVRDRAEKGDELGQLAPEVVEGLHDAGLFGMWVPSGLGGSELAPRQSLEVIEQLAYADASTGWVLMAAALATGTAGAYLPDAGVERLFGGGGRFPVIAGQGTRAGTAVPAEGGFELTGDWSFASGIKHAQYIHTAAAVPGTGDLRIFDLPVEQATLIDNWDVLGLRATGSIDYHIEGVYVPEEMSHPVLTTEPRRGGSFYRLGIINIAGICHSGWALGIGRRLLDEVRDLALLKTGRPGQLVDSDSFHGDYATAEAVYRAARALVFETWADVEATLDRDRPLSVRQETLIRLALGHVTAAAQQVSRFAYAAGGTTALRSGALQRCFRDMHAGTQHVTSSPSVLQACGRELAGLAPDQHWQFLALVDAQ